MYLIATLGSIHEKFDVCTGPYSIFGRSKIHASVDECSKKDILFPCFWLEILTVIFEKKMMDDILCDVQDPVMTGDFFILQCI